MLRLRIYILASAAIALSAFLLAPWSAQAGQTPKRVTVTGEIIDPWCYLSEIMWATGSAHHQCAVWCARGGIPVGILGDDEQVYIVLKMQDDHLSVLTFALRAGRCGLSSRGRDHASRNERWNMAMVRSRNLAVDRPARNAGACFVGRRSGFG